MTTPSVRRFWVLRDRLFAAEAHDEMPVSDLWEEVILASDHDAVVQQREAVVSEYEANISGLLKELAVTRQSHAQAVCALASKDAERAKLRDRMPKHIKLEIAADGDDVAEQIDKLVQMYELTKAELAAVVQGAQSLLDDNDDPLFERVVTLRRILATLPASARQKE